MRWTTGVGWVVALLAGVGVVLAADTIQRAVFVLLGLAAVAWGGSLFFDLFGAATKSRRAILASAKQPPGMFASPQAAMAPFFAKLWVSRVYGVLFVLFGVYGIVSALTADGV